MIKTTPKAFFVSRLKIILPIFLLFHFVTHSYSITIEQDGKYILRFYLGKEHYKSTVYFRKQVQQNELSQFNKFYVVYIQNNKIVAFDLIKDGKLYKRNIIHKLSKRSESDSLDIRNKKDDENNKDNSPKNSIPLDISLGKRTDILSFGSESFQALKHLLPKLYIKYLKVINISGKSISLKIINEDDIAFRDLSVSLDLYNKEGDIIGSLIAHSDNDIGYIDNYGAIKLASSKTNKAFTRIRAYIHYKTLTKNKWRYLGPIFFAPKRVMIKTKPLYPLKRLASMKE